MLAVSCLGVLCNISYVHCNRLLGPPEGDRFPRCPRPSGYVDVAPLAGPPVVPPSIVAAAEPKATKSRNRTKIDKHFIREQWIRPSHRIGYYINRIFIGCVFVPPQNHGVCRRPFLARAFFRFYVMCPGSRNKKRFTHFMLGKCVSTSLFR